MPGATKHNWDNDHDRLDEIRRQTHIAIAAKIDADPALLDVPQRNIERWTKLTGYRHPAYAEWLQILERPWPDVRRLLIADDENATRLRQSTPFVGVLSPWERRAIHESVPA
ncbi:MAG: hypothetical protein OXS50_12935 [Gammaproteobacteria bacterium]|nr:hypothetical protein [Gammaproteobacteria bacterium]